MRPTIIIPAFDLFLGRLGLRLEAVVIGGPALNLRGIVQRETRDCDVLSPPLAPEILAAARAFAAERRAAGESIRDDWLNNGPASLALRSLGRADLLKLKLFAFCDR